MKTLRLVTMLDDGSGEVDEMLERNFTDVEAKLVKDLFWVINEPKAELTS